MKRVVSGNEKKDTTDDEELKEKAKIVERFEKKYLFITVLLVLAIVNTILVILFMEDPTKMPLWFLIAFFIFTLFAIFILIRIRSMKSEDYLPTEEEKREFPVFIAAPKWFIKASYIAFIIVIIFCIGTVLFLLTFI